MASLYHFIVGMSLVIFVTGYNPFILYATTDQQMAASHNDLLFNITQLFANRTEPVLLNEEGFPPHLTSPIIQLTDCQKEELEQNFGPLLSPVAMDTVDDILCPTIGGRLILYLRLKQDGCLLQVITIIHYGRCQYRYPPGSCLDQMTDAALLCHCCVRYRTVVILAVKVKSCSTGSCQFVIVKVTVPYCTCCQKRWLLASSTEATELTTSPAELSTTTTELKKTPTHSTSATPSYRTILTTTPAELSTTHTDVTKPPTHSTSTTPSYRTRPRSTNWASESTRRSTTSTTSSSARSTVQHTTQRTPTSNETTNSN